MNKVFKIVWNSALNMWVVASELSRASSKKATSGAIVIFSLLFLNAYHTEASECNSSTKTCQLDSVWEPSKNNNGTGSVNINDGYTWAIKGPVKISDADSSYKVYSTVNSLINDGYINNSLIDTSLKYLNLGGKVKTIKVFDPITNNYTSVTVYDSVNFQTAYSNSYGAGVLKSGTLNIYNSTRFATVENGSNATLDLGTINISGGYRNSGLLYVDGTSSKSTQASVYGNINLNFGTEYDWRGNPQKKMSITKTEFSGAITAFDGTKFTVNSVGDVKIYNDWLISKLTSGKLNYNNYDSELNKAYISSDVTGSNGAYIVNLTGSNPDPNIINSPLGAVSLLAANGQNAKVISSNDAKITGSSGMGSEVSVFRLENKGVGINDGVLEVYYRTANVRTGGLFINNGSITNGPINGYGYTSTMIYALGTGSSFYNNGTVNVVPLSWTLDSGSYDYNSPIISSSAGKVVNNNLLFLGASEPKLGRNYMGGVRGITVTNASGENSSSGNIFVGRSPVGSDVYVKNGSSAIYSIGKSTFNNAGTITLGSKANGVYGIHSYGNISGSSVVNNGHIIVNSNGAGEFTPLQSVGILAENKSTGVNNASIIDLNGINNVGVKSLSGSVASTSGIININSGNDVQTGLANYGAWSEGAGSVINMSGTINLKNNGSVGVHARDGGKINMAGQGSVNFLNGKNQVGYYVYGSGSSITNSGSGIYDVSTSNSTLIRLDGGASLTGDSAATTSVTASGTESVAIAATGKGTSVNTGGMTINAKGNSSAALLVEGGATGQISATAHINLLGDGSVAGIADGQGHDLSGNNLVISDADKKSTTLSSNASLSSTIDYAVGYISRNMARLINGGDITFNGKATTGIYVGEGAYGGNTGDIVLNGSGSKGLYAKSSTLTTQLESTGDITLNGDWDGMDDASRSQAIYASGNKVLVKVGDGINSASVNLNGSGSVGAHATDGGKITLSDKVNINLNDNESDQIAFWVEGAGSSIELLTSSNQQRFAGDGATIFNITDGATMSGNLNMNLSGKAGSSKTTSGIHVSGTGSMVTLGGKSQLTIGTNSAGVLVDSAGKAVIEQGAVFNISGANGMLGKATGTDSLIENNASVTTLPGSSGSMAFQAENGGTLHNKSILDLSLGNNHTAINVNNGNVINTGNIFASGTAIHINGSNSTITNSGIITAVNGKAAIHVDAGAGLDLGAVSGTGTILARGTADGILLDAGATALNVANTIIDMSDASASGIGIHNVAGINGIKLDNTEIKVGGSGIAIKTGTSLAKTNTGTINVTDGTGILYLNENGSAVASDIDFSDSTGLAINVAGSGIGVKAMLDGNNRTVITSVGVNVNNAAGASAIDISGAKSVANSGKLISRSTMANGNVLNVHSADTISNSGIITASAANLAAIAMSNAGDKTFTNTGDIIGSLDFTSGDNNINLSGGTLTGNINASGGANTLTASNGSVQTGNVILEGNNANTVNVRGASTLGNLEIGGTAAHQLNVTDGSTTGTIVLGDGANHIAVDNSTVGNIITGTGNSQLSFSGLSVANDIKVGSGKNILTLQDSATMGHFVAGNGGENTVLVKGNASFASLDAGTGGANDSLTFDGKSYMLTNKEDVKHFDLLNLTNNSHFTTNQIIQMGDTAGSAGKVVIDGSSSLVLKPITGYTFVHALNGSGLVDVQSGTTFDFASTTGNQFAGQVKMNSTDFSLSGFNTAALTKAVLSVTGNNTTAVGGGIQTIGGLDINGGTVDFGTRILNAATSDAFIASTTLDASKTGRIKINRSGFDNTTAIARNRTKGLLDQQTETLVQLASASTVTGDAGNLTLVDENGVAITNGTATSIYQNGFHAADAYYDYRLTTKDNNGNPNGLYAGYGLTQLDLLTSGATELVLDTAASSEKVLSAKVTGTGDLGVKAGNGANALTLSNLDNSYSGVTDVQTGTLVVGTDNALGQTSKLQLANTSTANLNGKKQTIGELAGLAGSTLNINGGALTLSHGGSSAGILTGAGDITVAADTFTVHNANTALTARTTVKNGAEAVLEHVHALGTGQLIVGGGVTLDNTNGIFANQLSGNGQLKSHNGSDVRLSGDNSAFNGVMDIDAASTLTVSETRHIGGASSIQNANQLIVDNITSITLSTLVKGAGDLIKRNTGMLTLSGSNSYSGKTNIQNGTVAISTDASLGDGSLTNLTVLDGGKLKITADLTSARSVTLAKAGGVIVDDGKTATLTGWDDLSNSLSALTKEGTGKLVLSGDNSANTAQVNISTGTLQVENTANLASANGVVNLGAEGTLAIKKAVGTAADADFTRQLTGSGTLQVNLGNKDNVFTLRNTTQGGNFTGQLAMDNGRFTLDNTSATTLAQATLALNGNTGVGTLGSTKLNGNSTIGGLTMNGGQLEVSYSELDNLPEGHLTVTHLDVTGGGNLAITTADNLPNLLPVSGTSLFDQDDQGRDQIVAATTVNGVGSQIALTDAQGATIADDVVVGLAQGGVLAGNAHYNYLAAVKNDGLYVGYGLTELDAFAGQSLVLDNSTATDNALGAKLTGDGGFTVNASGTVRIGNAGSDYMGATLVNTGNVVLITDNSLGQTSQLSLQTAATIDLNGNAQKAGFLATQSGSLINLNNGALTLTGGGQADGELTGNGQLTLTGGTLSLSINNSLMKANVTIDTGATARLTQPQGLGQGTIINEGILNLDGAAGTLLNTLKGQGGDVQLSNSADMTLGGDNSGYAGTFTIESGSSLMAQMASHLGDSGVRNSGTLVLDVSDGNHWALDNSVVGSGNIIKRGTGIVTLDQNNVRASLTDIENGLLLVGSKALTAGAANLNSDMVIHKYGSLGGYGTVNGNLENQGAILLGSVATGGTQGTLTVNGNYTGNDGMLVFNTDLGDDSSATDKLVIAGDSRGHSYISVLSVRGHGAQTADGIKLIDVVGASTGQFTLKGRVTAGAYDYFLYQNGVNTPADGDWYLRSAADVTRPEAGSYVANTAAARKLFDLRLEDREGRAENSSMWLRQQGDRNKFRDSSGQIKTATNAYVIQGGGEVAELQFTGNDRLGIGLMLGYGTSNSESHSDKSGYRSKGTVNGYSGGAYATWYQDAKTQDGTYVDTWVQYSLLNANVTGEQLSGESYEMSGLSASVESGYRIPVYQGLNGDVFVTPQAQITLNGIKSDDHTERNGTQIKSDGNNNVQTRFGVKISRDGMSTMNRGAGKLFTTYAEANWLHNTEHAAAIMDGVTVKQAGDTNVGELKLGLEGKLNENANVWTNISQQLGDKGYSDTGVTIGFKYEF